MVRLKEGKYYGKQVREHESRFLRISLTTNDPNEAIHQHEHENPYLSILTSGEYLESTRRFEDQVIAGDILFRPSNHEHENRFQSSGGINFNIEFKKDWEEGLDLTLPDSFEKYKAGSVPELYQLLLHFKQGNAINELEEYIVAWHDRVHPPAFKANCRINEVRKILEHELDIFHSLTDLADRACVHPVYLSRSFRQKTGDTISAYQLKCKLEHALKQLLNTQASISTISHAHGFFDDAHFIRSFQSYYGRSPHQFRKTLKS